MEKNSENKLPKAVYAGLHLSTEDFHICISDHERPIVCVKAKRGLDLAASVLSWFRQYAKKNNYKFIAAGITGEGPISEIASKLWLDLDIFPFKLAENLSQAYDRVVQGNADYVASLFNTDNSFTAKVGGNGEVLVLPFISLKYYEANSKSGDFNKLLDLSEKFKGRSISFISATAQGGGVALMRHGLVRLYRALGVAVSWHILASDEQVFEITKDKFHNVLQGVSKGPGLTKSDIAVYEHWIAKNAKIFHDVLARPGVFVIDDPQPAGLIPYIKKANKSATIIYRSHIELRSDLVEIEGSKESVTWNYLKKFINLADIFVSHPVPSFVPKDIDKKKVVYMPATTDPLDGLNKELTDNQKKYYMKVFDNLLSANGQKPLDPTRPYIIQIARFDPSKGIADVLLSYKKLVSEMKAGVRPQLVIVGNSSVDDPDGGPIYKKVMGMLGGSDYSDLREDVKVLRLPPYDQLLNALLRGAHIALQLSHAEGFEVKVTEALMKGVPVIAYKAGGIPLQIKDGVSGFLVKIGDTDTVCTRMHELMEDKELYKKMAAEATKNVNPKTTNVANAIAWLTLCIRPLGK